MTGEDAFYVGGRLPFNHFYVKFDRPSELTNTKMTLEYWDGTVWVPMVEIIDETKGFSQNGFVQFVPNKDKNWAKESTKYAGEQVDDLESLVIYDRYWLRIKFDQSFDGGEDPDNIPNRLPCQVSWLGNLFSNDEDLATEHRSLVRTVMITAFQAGKTSWQEEHAKAAEIIIDDLIDMGVIIEKGQILDRSDFKLAGVSRVAEMIYFQLGDDYVDQYKAAANEYRLRVSKRRPKIDTNLNGVLDPSELVNSQGFLTR